MSFADLGPYLFIVVAGWLATDIWRWAGVLVGNRIDETSEVLNWVRAVATALVAAVIAKMIFFPTGALETSPLWLRLAAVVFGALAFFVGGRFRQIAGIAAAIAFLAAGLAIIGP
ncbi:AzlD domain-containing protein [Shinella fusca]|jgi:branched-subunit amino acid transport protein|uniref:Branched-subunit amino acid transport protein n=1 Tax=Shinella fusca TaxID=544480 RepID=A0A7W8DUC4_9HYPH|nr:AzlD domain-containing protein [Shinella fusca]MBB5041796.1 branched-subunit amino acid transport protein [Shinella fusca]